jgi:hypothetical protein
MAEGETTEEYGMEVIIIAAVLLIIFIGAPVYFLLRLRLAQKRGMKWFPSRLSVISWAIASVSLVWIIILAAFFKFQINYQWHEVPTNLGCIYTTQGSYRAEYYEYAGGPNAFELLHWEPAGMSLYAYYCGDEVIANSHGDSVSYRPDGDWPFTIRPASSRDGFTCLAIGDYDHDDFPDVWMMNDRKELIRVIDDRYNEDTGNFLIGSRPLTLTEKWAKFKDENELFFINPKLPSSIFLFSLGLLVLSIIRDEVRWRRARKAAR